jgi:transposase-like protein
MKQVSQDTVVQAISLLQQGKSVREVKRITGLSKSAVGRLRKNPLLWTWKAKRRLTQVTICG